MDENNITRLDIDGKEVIIIGTAHVSKKSAEQVKEVIETERPDSVCVELDEQRYQSVREGNKWKDMNIFKVVKEKKSTLLLMNMMISSFQNRVAKQFGIKPGQEMIQGIDSAEEVEADLVLADRNIQTTFSRVWRSIGVSGRAKLMLSILYSIFNRETISEQELEKMKQQDMLNSVMQEFTEAFPRLKKPLIDERDQYLAQKIKDAPGDKVVAVLGAAHVPGVKREINKEQDLDQLTTVPPKSKAPKVIAWMIPILILSIIAYTFMNNPDAAYQQTLSWILWNGSMSALGAAIAFGHPLTIMTAFLVAPLSSLNPMLAAGWFAGIVQASIRKPHVSDFENIAEDVTTVKGFWQNKVTRVLLIVVLTNIGSSLGTFIGGADVIRVFFENL
ncbi:TraB/GumN family protein [Alkalibacillus haloalkaliphilus]|uniref:Conjugal transfer protein TraB n=1 Tax=Alkalibacillus haloalkaliphilus TaxID=94136 RepID=A0A511W2I4_9BACI|nr:TraB/GumN family protein [Alkalibacillus haloalkaliphilus]MDV2581511.1 TraB/GumN family protein [Alkalibacillus haloalkaliphilus]GEN44588.1 conjugal transfer protein TraB [Alkalibacillus haloalkaliphilus]